MAEAMGSGASTRGAVDPVAKSGWGAPRRPDPPKGPERNSFVRFFEVAMRAFWQKTGRTKTRAFSKATFGGGAPW
jgi:hypothetical protein